MRDVLCKKVMILAIICLFIGASVVSGIGEYHDGLEHVDYNNEIMSSELLVEDELDQYNHVTKIWFIVCYEDSGNYQFLAQSFKPTLPILTRVKLFLSDMNMTCDLIVSIRSDINGSDLTSVSVNHSEIPAFGDFDWIEFDFSDISVEVGETYYIVATSYCGYGTYDDAYCWNSSNDDEYPHGESWGNSDWFPFWFSHPYDLCFETYGISSNLEVKISGGFRVNAIITNNGTTTASDVPWSIDLEGGLILAGQHTDGVISELAPGATKTIRQSTLYGIGRTTITVTAGDATKQATGFILGPLVLGVKEIS